MLKQEYYEELRREIKVHESILERKRKEKYEKNYKYCKSIVHSYLELAFKIAEYRNITNKFVWFLFWLDIVLSRLDTVLGFNNFVLRYLLLVAWLKKTFNNKVN